jgi:hypothetical protein
MRNSAATMITRAPVENRYKHSPLKEMASLIAYRQISTEVEREKVTGNREDKNSGHSEEVTECLSV